MFSSSQLSKNLAFKMLIHSGIITNSLWTPSRRPILFPLFRCFFISANDFISSSSSKASCVDDDCLFLPWLKRKAGAEISTALSIGMSSYGRALYASEQIKRGDCLLEVPFSVQLSPENLRPEFRKLIKDDVCSVAKVAVVILYEKKMGQHSEWEPYISRLPLPEDMHSSIFWSDEELGMIFPSCLYQETLKQKMLIQRDYLGVKLVFDEFPDLFQDPTLEEFTCAYQLVQSRAWESPKGVSLIPFADFLNHDNTSGAYLFGNQHKQHSEVTADRDYAVGDEVRIRYGKFSNAELLLGYGFTLSNTTYDFFQVDLMIPHDDELYTQKFDILHNLRAPSMKKDNEFTLCWNSFKIKQRKGIPLSLRAFARILVCKSQQELDDLREEATQSDGRVARYPLKNKVREIAAHQLLLSKVSQLIGKHNQHIKLLVPTTSDLRRRLAQDLLQGELRVMKSARDWLANYCFMLRTN
ncbi:hypothetical protein ACS0TY_012041 [Phlomoides rotata]